jgi:predicted dinucleotide-binding enzyme
MQQSSRTGGAYGDPLLCTVLPPALKRRGFQKGTHMNIGILGAGRIGTTVAQLFAQAGHQVSISNSRDPASLAALLTELGPNVRTLSQAETVAFGEIVLIMIPWAKRDTLPPANLFTNKIVIDAMNQYPPISHGGNTKAHTSSEEVAGQFPGARIVKAFNTLYYEILRTGSRTTVSDRLVLFVAGDDAAAKAIVSQLIEQIGYAPFDTGSLHAGSRQQQPGSPAYNQQLTVEGARELLARI